MNTITAYYVSYPKPPKGWKGMGFYFEKKVLGTTTAPAEAFAEDCVEAVKAAFPECNALLVCDSDHPAGWMSGSC